MASMLQASSATMETVAATDGMFMQGGVYVYMYTCTCMYIYAHEPHFDCHTIVVLFIHCSAINVRFSLVQTMSWCWTPQLSSAVRLGRRRQVGGVSLVYSSP